MIQTQIRQEWFRNSRTYKAALKIFAAMEKFNALASRDFHTAVTAAQLDVAITLLNAVGKGNMAHQLISEFRIAEQRAVAAASIPKRTRKTRKVETATEGTQNGGAAGEGEQETKSRSRGRGRKRATATV